MNHISIRKFGLAFGLTGALLYFGCTLVMLILGHDSSVKFFNTLLQGKSLMKNIMRGKK